MMAKVKAVFFLPLRDNDGRDLTAERKAAEDDLFTLFVGWTCLGEVQGAYRMADGTRSLDDHRAYAVMTDDTRIADIEDVLRRFKAKTTQEAIYLELQYNTETRLV
jgi:hypothetical protein